MTKLKFEKLNLDEKAVLTRDELKNVLGANARVQCRQDEDCPNGGYEAPCYYGNIPGTEIICY